MVNWSICIGVTIFLVATVDLGNSNLLLNSSVTRRDVKPEGFKKRRSDKIGTKKPIVVDVNDVKPIGSEKEVTQGNVMDRTIGERVTIKLQKGLYKGKMVSIVSYKNNDNKNYKIAFQGELPASLEKLLQWLITNGHLYNPSEVGGDSSGNQRSGVGQIPKAKPKKVKKAKVGSNGFPTKCGVENGVFDRVTGGKAIPISRRPWQIGLVEKNTRGAFCGGSAISLKHIITAAHCMSENGRIKSPNQFEVYAGAEDIWKPVQIGKVQQVFVHEKYNDRDLTNDISLLILASPLKESETLTPICLPPANANYDAGHGECTISGWGRVSQNAGGGERYLRYANVKVLPRENCKKIYHHQLGNGMFCGGNPKKGKGTCYGDSGGPFACKDNGRYHLYGLTSWGIECDSFNYPAVYTKVALYLDWINQRLGVSRARRQVGDDSEDDSVEEDGENEDNEDETDDNDERISNNSSVEQDGDDNDDGNDNNGTENEDSPESKESNENNNINNVINDNGRQPSYPANNNPVWPIGNNPVWPIGNNPVWPIGNNPVWPINNIIGSKPLWPINNIGNNLGWQFNNGNRRHWPFKQNSKK